MAWCDTCDRVVADDEAIDGRCDRCETELSGAERGPLPWKFRLMIIATVIYLAYRAYQGVTWLLH